MLVNTVLVLVITLLSIAASGTAEAVFSSFKILGPSGAVLETFTQRSGEVKHIDLRSSTKVEVCCVVFAPDETVVAKRSSHATPPPINAFHTVSSH